MTGRTTTVGDPPPKRKLVKDPLWGSIVLLPWEELIVETPVFTRLHGILQNSSAYRVYPGMRVSRFAHSIGTMYVSSEIFQAAVANSAISVMSGENEACLGSEASRLCHGMDALALDQIVFETRRHFNLTFITGEAAGKEFYVLLAVLRVAALLHDAGHLPYSHIFEFSIEYAAIAAERHTEQEDQLVGWKQGTRRHLRDLKESKTEHRRKFHEIVGTSLMAVLSKFLSGHQSHVPYGIIASQLIDCSSKVLAGDYATTKTFIDGVIDADRIDFVRRDAHFSGLFNSSVDFGRLFKLYELAARKAQDHGVIETQVKELPFYAAMPGPRSISDAEKLLWERIQDYKYIACHHRVHLHDELLERCIEQLIRLGRLDPFLERTRRLLRPVTPQGVAGALDGMLEQFNMTIAILTEFDDAWLDLQFRTVYRDILNHTLILGDEGPQRYCREVIRAYVVGIETHMSAFGKEDDFWSYAEKRAPVFAEVRHMGANEKFDELSGIAGRVNGFKRDLELKFLNKYGAFVVIGDISHKLKIGFGINHLRAYSSMKSLAALRDFLAARAGDSPPFNFWLPRDQGRLKDAIFDAIIERIDDQQVMRPILDN